MNEPDSVEEAIYNAARQFADANELRAYLDLACDGKPEMRQRIERLLGVCSEADSFFKRNAAHVGGFFPSASEQSPINPLASDAPSSPATPLTEGLGAVIGRYKLLEKIGEGGMGVVYVAEQDEPVRRRVALKIIKLGMETRQVVARFEAERQALAMMDHPNIAKVLDGGATDSPLTRPSDTLSPTGGGTG